MEYFIIDILLSRIMNINEYLFEKDHSCQSFFYEETQLSNPNIKERKFVICWYI